MQNYRISHVDRGEQYDASIASSPFDAYMDVWEKRYVREIVASVFPAKIPRYLDFACGTGRLTAIVAPLAVEAVGVDIAEGMLALAADKVPSARFVCGDLTKSGLNLGVFDFATAFRFFGNADPELRASALRALNRAVRSGGYLLFNNHRNPSSIRNLLIRAARGVVGETLSHRLVKHLLGENGFSVAQARPIGAWMYRAKLMVHAGSNPAAEERLERLFGATFLAPYAPDALILARKVRDLGRAE